MKILKTMGIVKSDDIELLQRYRKTKDLRFAAQLYERYLERIFGVCLAYIKDPIESQDAGAEIFEIIVKKSLTHQIQDFDKWIYVVTKNHCLQMIRKKKSQLNQLNNYAFMQMNGVAHPIDETEPEFIWMEECLEQLPEHQKDCIKSFYLEKQTYDEISKRLNIHKEKVRSYMQNGRRNLKYCMQNKHEKAE